MRYFLALFILGGFYFYAFRGDPARPVVPSETSAPVAVAQTTPAAVSSSNFLKRPLDRTHGVLDQVRANRDANRF